MKILKPGKVEQRKFTCPKCGCIFVASTTDITWHQCDYNKDAVDAVEVVRCKGCSYSREVDRSDTWENFSCEDCIWCNYHDMARFPEEFCSDGERKEKQP